MVIELYHPTDPRFLMVDELPDRVSVDDLRSWRYGKALLFSPGPVVAVYKSLGAGEDFFPAES